MSGVEIILETCEQCGSKLVRNNQPGGAWCPKCNRRPVDEPTRTSPRKESPRGVLAEQAVLGLAGFESDAAIRDSEARGQRDLVTSASLPAFSHYVPEDKEKWPKARAELVTQCEAIGVTLGHPFENDPLFCEAQLPQGWGKQGTDHDMWSHVVDDKGRVRLHVFYKAAFYDRKAHMSVVERFKVTTQSSMRYEASEVGRWEELPPKDGDEDLIVMDLGTMPPSERFRQKVLPRPENRDDREAMDAYWEASEKARAACYAWLAEHYPEHKDPTKYWDEV